MDMSAKRAITKLPRLFRRTLFHKQQGLPKRPDLRWRSRMTPPPELSGDLEGSPKTVCSFPMSFSGEFLHSTSPPLDMVSLNDHFKSIEHVDAPMFKISDCKSYLNIICKNGVYITLSPDGKATFEGCDTHEDIPGPVTLLSQLLESFRRNSIQHVVPKRSDSFSQTCAAMLVADGDLMQIDRTLQGSAVMETTVRSPKDMKQIAATKKSKLRINEEDVQICKVDFLEKGTPERPFRHIRGTLQVAESSGSFLLSETGPLQVWIEAPCSSQRTIVLVADALRTRLSKEMKKSTIC